MEILPLLLLVGLLCMDSVVSTSKKCKRFFIFILFFISDLVSIDFLHVWHWNVSNNDKDNNANVDKNEINKYTSSTL